MAERERERVIYGEGRTKHYRKESGHLIQLPSMCFARQDIVETEAPLDSFTHPSLASFETSHSASVFHGVVTPVSFTAVSFPWKACPVRAAPTTRSSTPK